jgi:transcriptional regulator with XRE-family HTH domain
MSTQFFQCIKGCIKGVYWSALEGEQCYQIGNRQNRVGAFYSDTNSVILIAYKDCNRAACLNCYQRLWKGDDEMALGENIRKLREEAQLTQQQLADRLYVSRQTISRWESGTRCPDLITAKRLAMELQISLDALISDEEIKNMEDMKSLYFWRGPRWKERERLKEYKSKLYRVLEIFGSVFLGIMILLMKMERKLPVWCTVTGFVIVLAIWIWIWMVDKKMERMEE